MYEPLVEIGAVLLYALGSVLLTALGLLAEYDGLQTAASGDSITAIWLGVMGAVALIAGVMLARDKVLRRVLA
ncbi:hypothetical protein SAMN05421858_0238 [Haladaptatus litoreus]|uniref:DUF8151 domain-containing protein n=1 Tax=Haladaptatus litoreus TaxID=553468 RepID=A0A1N6V736_9EURY|nr:hypothetical protein [Haladaptatus litoreus]SIQ73693.1 hypothetical protein SAMN05421858_0238 [Haladaptatus litoreus]